MRALSVGLLLVVTTLSSSHAQRSPDSLPDVTVDCFQSFVAKTQLPELPPARHGSLVRGNYVAEFVSNGGRPVTGQLSASTGLCAHQLRAGHEEAMR
jgi:hypothetical protein